MTKTEQSNKQWFESWFDTKWYHLLYCNRDENEAKVFIQNLMRHLNLPPNSTILDLACGKGRHASTLHDLGYTVWGVDLSEQSIEHAKTKSDPTLHFAVHDMRQTFKPNHFDLITNLFTSFGYFNNSTDNMRVMQSVWEGLKPNGIFVLDFMNAQKVIDELTHQEHIVKGDLTFNISRKLENNVIVKLIDFEAEGKHHHFEERVTGFSLQDLQELFEPCCLKIEAVFGDYELGEFNEHKSPRLILVARKV